MALRQRAYSRRASQQEDLAESRSRHEEFRSSMFSTSRGFTPALSHAGSGSAGGGGGSVGSDKPTDRIEAAILAGMAVDAQRGTHTFNTVAITPAHSSTGSPAYVGHDQAAYHPRGGAGRVNGGVGGGGNLHGAMSHPGAHHGGGDGYYGDVGGGGYSKTYYPPSGGGGGGGGNGQPSRGVPLDGSAQSGSLARSDGSHGAGLNESGGGVGVRGSSGGDSRGGGSGSSVGEVFRYSGEKPPQPSPHHHQHTADNGDSSGRGGMSVSSAGGSSNERQRRPAGGGGSGGENTRSVWRHDSPATAGGVDGGRSNGRKAEREAIALLEDSGSSEAADDRRRKVSGQDAFGSPEWDEHVMPVKAGSGGTALDDDSGRIALTPTEYEEPLELPDGCHHISLSKFLEVMTGPGLRVRKHHRAGKGSSGLRVLRYAPEEDSLTWDSHKILGAAQHVLPMADVQRVSMESGNRVVLTCVGGRDSYAVFEAANDDAGAVLYVGLERLRQRTVS